MPLLYHGSHLGFHGIIRARKNGTLFFLCLYHILTESGEFLLLPKNTRIFISLQMSLHYIDDAL